jgi:hypothetical protein
MTNKVKTVVSNVAAIGAVKRRGVSALKDYGGSVSGKGHVTHKSGPNKGKKTHFDIDGEAGK